MGVMVITSYLLDCQLFIFNIYRLCVGVWGMWCVSWFCTVIQFARRWIESVIPWPDKERKHYNNEVTVKSEIFNTLNHQKNYTYIYLPSSEKPHYRVFAEQHNSASLTTMSIWSFNPLSREGTICSTCFTNQ